MFVRLTRFTSGGDLLRQLLVFVNLIDRVLLKLGQFNRF